MSLEKDDSESKLSDSEETRLETHLEPTGDEENSSSFRLSPPSLQGKLFFFVFVICSGLVFHWFSTSELFEIPEDVVQTRNEFAKAKESYTSNAAYWDAKLGHFKEVMNHELSFGEHAFLELVQETPGEIFVSFLLQHLNLPLDRLEHITAFPRKGSSFSVVISKPEGGIWPLKIMLSMEIEIKYTAEKFALAISRLRRGSQDIALSLAWAYFGPELESLRAFETKAHQVILVTTKD